MSSLFVVNCTNTYDILYFIKFWYLPEASWQTVVKQIPRGQHWKEPALPFKKLPVKFSKPEITWKLCFWSVRTPEIYAFEGWDHLVKVMLNPGDHPWSPYCGRVYLYSEIHWPAARWENFVILDALKCLIGLSGKYLGQHCWERYRLYWQRNVIWWWLMNHYWVGEKVW